MKSVRNTNTSPSREKTPGSKRIGIFGVVALVIVSSFATILSPMLTNQASAVSAEDVLNRARAWSILNAVIDKRDLIDSTISTEDAGTCHIFGAADNLRVNVGSHVTGDNSVSTQGAFDGAKWNALEENAGAATNALESVGIQGGCRGLLEKIGYTYDDGDLVQPDDFGNKLSERIRNALKPDAFFGAKIGDGGPGAALTYAILAYNLKNVCGWEYRNAYDTNAAGEAGTRSREAKSNGWSGEETGKHYHTYTYEKGQAGDNVYYRGGGTDNDVSVGSKTGAGSGTSGNNDAVIDCGDNTGDTFGALLAPDHNPRFADAYAALLKPGSSATPGTCEDKYGPGAEMNACVQGFAHKDSVTFCTDTFEAGALRDACVYGQKTATGTTGVTAPAGEEEPAEDKTTCAIVGVGWIICPIVTFLSQIVDAAYAFVSSLLFIQPLFSTADSNTVGVYNAWSTMRNFANIAFVMAFLVIIYSQLTNAGITNYGIKKLLPKLIVAAVLVNVSYWVCAIAVDVSNILGGSINGVLKGIGEGGLVAGPNAAEFGAKGQNWAGITAFILAGGALLATGTFFVALAALLPALVAVLVAIVVTLMILTIRQGLIILLIVVSPLAFVAFLLPNTSSIFKKWKDLFQTLLIMYPIVSLIFGASALASAIIMNSASGTYQIAIQIMGAVVAILPLIIVPALIKAATGVLNKVGLGGFVSGINMNGLKKKAEGYRDYRSDVAKGKRIKRAGNIMEGDGKGLGGQYSRRRRVAAFLATGGATSGIDRDKKRGFAKAATDEGAQQYFAKRALNQEGFAEGVAGDAAQGLKASAQSAVDKILRQDIENREILLAADVKYKNDPQAALNDALKKGDGIQASAAMNMLMKTGAGGYDKIHDSLAKAESDPSTSAAVMERMRDHVKTNGQAIKAKDPSLTTWASQGGAKSLNQVASDASSFNKSDAELVGFSPKAFQEAASRGLVDQARAQAIKANQTLFKDASPANKAIIEAIASGGPLPPPPPR